MQKYVSLYPYQPQNIILFQSNLENITWILTLYYQSCCTQINKTQRLARKVVCVQIISVSKTTLYLPGDTIYRGKLLSRSQKVDMITL